METTIITRTLIINELLKVSHKKADIYTDTGMKAIKAEPEFFAHMIAWNHKNSKVRSSKVAFPVIALRESMYHENAVAHLCLLDPKNLIHATEYNKSLIQRGLRVWDGAGKLLKYAVNRYIRTREQNRNWWNKTVVQHRKSMKGLYSYYHIKPAPFAQDILFDNKRPDGSIFETIANLKNMPPKEAAGTIMTLGIPYNIAVSVIPDIKDPDIVMALMERMSGAELITNTKMLENLGVFDTPTLKIAYEEAMQRAKKDKRVSTLKASHAAKAVKSDQAKEKLAKIQEDQLDTLSKVEGDWLILGDKSGSMRNAIDLAQRASALIAKQIKGRVYLVFFDTFPTPYEVTGLSYEEIINKTKSIRADGATSIGVGLEWLMVQNIPVNGIVICSDGGQNRHPAFPEIYKEYTEKLNVEPPVYFFKLKGERDRLSNNNMTVYDLRNDVDFYSLPQIIPTLRANKFSLANEIWETPLLTLKEVFNA